MAAQRKYPEELRKRAVKMLFEIRERDGKGWTGAVRMSSRSGGRRFLACGVPGLRHYP